MPVITGFETLSNLPEEKISPQISRRVMSGAQGMIVWWSMKAGAYAAGDFGSLLERKDGAWTPIDLGVEVFDSFHAVWVDPGGGVWAVGGQVDSEPLSDGMMIHSGTPVPGGIHPPDPVL